MNKLTTGSGYFIFLYPSKLHGATRLVIFFFQSTLYLSALFWDCLHLFSVRLWGASMTPESTGLHISIEINYIGSRISFDKNRFSRFKSEIIYFWIWTLIILSFRYAVQYSTKILILDYSNYWYRMLCSAYHGFLTCLNIVKKRLADTLRPKCRDDWW